MTSSSPRSKFWQSRGSVPGFLRQFGASRHGLSIITRVRLQRPPFVLHQNTPELCGEGPFWASRRVWAEKLISSGTHFLSWKTEAADATSIRELLVNYSCHLLPFYPQTLEKHRGAIRLPQRPSLQTGHTWMKREASTPPSGSVCHGNHGFPGYAPRDRG